MKHHGNRGAHHTRNWTAACLALALALIPGEPGTAQAGFAAWVLRGTTRSVERSAVRSVERSAVRSVERSTVRAGERGVAGAAERSTANAADRSLKAATERNAERAAATTERSMATTADRSATSATDRSIAATEGRAAATGERTVTKTMTSMDGSAARTAETSAAVRHGAAELQARDAANHARASVKPLPRARSVYRYGSAQEARTASSVGMRADKHMTSSAGPGRPVTGVTAQERYGLPAQPEVRMRIRIPQGQPVRFNKVVGGAPGVGEITSPKSLPPSAIEDVVPLR